MTVTEGGTDNAELSDERFTTVSEVTFPSMVTVIVVVSPVGMDESEGVTTIGT